ncbi:hypothetical protein Asppvi_001721 [Aspergillus pseudoviridinutans]|uniref:Uncharacterized protein n=1 Tax=Aspergillus pseudoviridinutans TaxID=1517512 RepID=A0A9P3B2F1_9EURO|nr:uncharacterized protein Asppvi_001721 [Aspergillus pseudoviridinutans]GIJ83202.1 hypothetical protein Asppvi_001721 [Aspergillus pseudoviridinutans]
MSMNNHTAVLEGLGESKYWKQEIRAQIQQSIQEFSDGCGDAIKDLSHRGIVGPSRLDVRPNMDIIIFDVSENERDQRSFEYVFSNYLATTHQQQILGGLYSPWSALIPRSQGWVIDHHSSSNQSEQTRTVQFISIFSCETEGAREEWSRDFAQRAQTEYDLLGHIVDWLRTLCKHITIQHLVLQKQDFLDDRRQVGQSEAPAIASPTVYF